MLYKVYARLRDSYACTFTNKTIEIDVGFGFVLTITHELRAGLNIFKIVSNRGSNHVYIDCPLDKNGYSDIIPLYRFIEDFSRLL